MGIARCATKLLTSDSKKDKFKGSVLQLGRQDIYLTFQDLINLANELGIEINQNIEITRRKNIYHPELDAIDDVCFFKALGFETVHSIDASSFEDSTYVHDLNSLVPASLHNRYDLIFDGGTMEHIFHVPNVLNNIHSMLKENGRISHYSPTHNFVDHGFYMFSPTFFYDYYTANRYKVETSLLVGRSAPINNFEDVTTFDYRPGVLDQYSVGGVNKENFKGCEIFGMFFTARKSSESASGLVPQQGFYKKVWSDSKH